MLVDKPIKLLTLNVSVFDENNEKLTQFFKDMSPDIICLQEVTRKVDEWAFDSFITKGAIDKATPRLLYSFFAPNVIFKEFKQNNFHGKKIFYHDFGGFIEFGNYIKSKFQIIEGTSVFVQHHFSYLDDSTWMENHQGKEPRMVQVADIKINPKQKLRLINYHGIWTRNKQGTKRTKEACEQIVKLAAEVSHPSIICGDLNLFPNTESVKVLKDNFVSLVDEYNVTRTRPKSNELSGEKRNVVDYIFVSREIKPISFKVIDSDVSDHLPLLLEFSL